MACQSGFLQRIKIISPYLSCKCCTVGQQLHCVMIRTRSYHFGQMQLSIVYYISTFNRLSKHFNLDEAWFNTQSIRMSVPMIARAAREPTTTILHMGRWKSVPSSMKCQEQSTAVNDHIISIASNPTYYTAVDILLSLTLAARAHSSKPTVQSSNPTVRRF